MKYSKQRELILNMVKSNPIHPDAETVYHALRPECPGLSLGTVYRNLNVLVEHGMIQKLAMPYASDRFDGRTDAHCHMVCERCGRVFDAETGDIFQMAKEVMQQNGFKVTSAELVLRGICGECGATQRGGER